MTEPRRLGLKSVPLIGRQNRATGASAIFHEAEAGVNVSELIWPGPEEMTYQ